MPRIQFAVDIVDLNGSPVEEPVKTGFIKEVHKQLRQILIDTGKCPEPLLTSFDGLCAATKILTVGDVCCRALGGGQNDSIRDAKKLVERLDLIRQIMAAEKDLKPLDLDASTIGDICKAVEKAPMQLYVVMQTLEALNGNVPVPEAPTTESESKPKA